MEEIKKQVEVQANALPPATLETLKKLRQEACGQKEFHLASFQLFLRRILSPDSPVRNMLLVHGTGVGKSCSAIQVAEEYILRPEFQDKKVLVLASASVQDNFRTQIFDVSRVKQDPAGLMMSQQCTGRRYLDMLERAQQENLRWENPENREKLNTIVQKMIAEFYDFSGYVQFSNLVEKKRINLSPADFEVWVHETFDGKLLIIDEAHNIREQGDDEMKLAATSIQRIVKIANGMTLVLLTATPMYDSFEEIILFFNLFLWNDKRQTRDARITAAQFFKEDGSFKNADKEAEFRGWCHEYISFIRGENPFTFPFRLPPPETMIAPADRTKDYKGRGIKVQRKYLPLVGSVVESPQKERVLAVSGKIQEDMIPTIVVSPDGRSITKCFEKPKNAAKFQYRYAGGLVPFLSPSHVRAHATKFATIIKCIQESTGIVFIYSNYVRGGALQFAMCLEEHGFEPAAGLRLLENPSGEYKGGSQGKYAFLTSDSDKYIAGLIRRLRKPENSTGQDIRVIIGSPIISEGTDFKNVRQVHILDPWFNMSRMEQIIGRGLRTCSHTGLAFEEQNCTIYLHTTRYADDDRETYDEFVYRAYVEEKAKGIARVKRVLSESAVDCMTQLPMNQLPEAWRELVIPQRRSQDRQLVEMALSTLSAPTFEDGTAALVCSVKGTTRSKVVEASYTRPLSSYLDVRDQIFDELIEMFEKKPMWKEEDLLEKLNYAPEVVTYILESAVNEHLKLKDTSGRVGTLENRAGVYAFSPTEVENGSLFERTIPDKGVARVSIEVPEEAAAPPPVHVDTVDLGPLRTSTTFPFATDMFPEGVIDWYIVDQVMPAEQKQSLLLSRPTPTPPYANGLLIEDLDYMVLGDGKVYNQDKNLVDLVGTELDAYKMWAMGHIDRIATQIKEGKILCTTEKGTLKIAAFDVNVDGHIERVARTKTIAAKECTSFNMKQLEAFAKDTIGTDFPEGAKGKETRCQFLGLVAHSGSSKLVWVLPEIWSVISGTSFSGKLRDKIK